MNKIYLIGDSTCQTNFKDTYPQTGWGQVFFEYVNPNYEVINLAKNGRSSKSFYNEGLFKECENNIKENDFLFIQFGHNDEKEDLERHTDPYTTYQEQLKYYINVTKRNRATPVLLTSIYRRRFANGKLIEKCHLDYPDAMIDLANKENIICIDMCSLTKDYLNSIGEEASRELFMNFDANIYPNYMEGKEDNTHLRYKGAKAICDILTNQIKKYDSLRIILK